MAKAVVDQEKKNILSSLKMGDKVELTTGKVVIFKKLNITKFLGEEGTTLWNIPINMFKRVAETTDGKVFKEYENLMPGELFYINDNDKAVMYKFEKCLGLSIVCVNPITNRTEFISVERFVGAVPRKR